MPTPKIIVSTIIKGSVKNGCIDVNPFGAKLVSGNPILTRSAQVRLANASWAGTIPPSLKYIQQYITNIPMNIVMPWITCAHITARRPPRSTYAPAIIVKITTDNSYGIPNTTLMREDIARKTAVVYATMKMATIAPLIPCSRVSLNLFPKSSGNVSAPSEIPIFLVLKPKKTNAMKTPTKMLRNASHKTD